VISVTERVHAIAAPGPDVVGVTSRLHSSCDALRTIHLRAHVSSKHRTSTLMIGQPSAYIVPISHLDFCALN
jgi:hypothetical protein